MSQAERKLDKAGRVLAKVEESLKPAEHVKDLEPITEEERFMFRKLGLRMKAFLLLGNFTLNSQFFILGSILFELHIFWQCTGISQFAFS